MRARKRLRQSWTNSRFLFEFKNGQTFDLKLAFKDPYKDECTSDVRPHMHMCEAMADEIAYLCKEVVEGVTVEEARADPEHVIVGGRVD